METAELEAVKRKLKELIATELDVSVNSLEIQDDASLYEDGLGLDSISIVNLIVLIETRFNIRFEENEINSKMFSSVTSVANFINSKLLV